MNDEDFWKKLEEYNKNIIFSHSPKKLIVAGPGTGKTTLFKEVVKSLKIHRNQCLALTFINNLKSELEEGLSGLANVYTFHGYCHFLLRRNKELLAGLTSDFKYFPKLIHLVKTDWKVKFDSQPPQFIRLMRELKERGPVDFYLKRSNYYDAVGYDDSVFRVYQYTKNNSGLQKSYCLVIVDEYQDFNLLEVSFLKLLSHNSPVLIAGDDDQALYCHLRNSSPQHIRDLFQDSDFEKFELPFCTRCPEVIVNSFDDIVKKAKSIGKLHGRIDKPFRYFPPLKTQDSKKYPKIKIVHTQIQRESSKQGANYFGRYIVEQITKIPKMEIEQSNKEGYPTILIIGPKPYLPQIQHYLEYVKWQFDIRKKGDEPVDLNIEEGLEILKRSPDSNLGWRIVLEVERPQFFNDIIKKSLKQQKKLSELIPRDYKEKILKTIKEQPKEESIDGKAEVREKKDEKATIKLCSFEGAKGLSAQHVFVVGLQNGDLPRNCNNVLDIEICKLLVALTRTRKQCQLLYTTNFAGKKKHPSKLLDWIDYGRKELVNVDRGYWG